MKNGIPCNETQYTPGNERNKITYRFVTGDRDIPARCTIQMGDTDPATGEQVTEVSFFREYYKLVDHEIYQNLNAKRPQYTPGSMRNQITYRFVTGDKEIPARCTIHLGSTDPITGERMTEVNFFREYYRLADHEIYQTLKAKRPLYTQKQKPSALPLKRCTDMLLHGMMSFITWNRLKNAGIAFPSTK